MNVAVIRFPGTNCEFDTQYAFAKLGANVSIVWHKDESLPDNAQLVVVPGGFSYGDYLRCGAIAQFSPIMQAIKHYADSGGYVLGICNGFQILCEAGLLYTGNPNGSVEAIAGVCNENKNVFGLMPHPERAIEAILGSCDGVAMLDNLLQIPLEG